MGIGFPRAAGESAGKCGVGIEASIRGGGARREWEDKAGDRGLLHDRLSWFGHTWLVPTAEQVVAVTNFESRVHRIRKSRTSGSAARRYRLSEQPHFQSRSNVSDRCGRLDRVVPWSLGKSINPHILRSGYVQTSLSGILERSKIRLCQHTISPGYSRSTLRVVRPRIVGS